MHVDEFDYDLPEHLIAQEPASRRDESRLLVLRRDDARLAHHVFADLPELLAPGDLLVLNDTRVVAARLVGRRARTGGKWEGLFVRPAPDGTWELLVQTRGTLLAGEVLVVESANDPPLRLTLVGKTPQGRWLVQPGEVGPFAEVLSHHGQVPIPPYIRKGRAGPADSDRYQTVFARQEGAVAAPTAGLHFTAELFERLAQRRIDRAFVTLHVGPGTFQPVKVQDVTEHHVEPEWGELPPVTAAAVAACKARGGRVVAIGTTTVRVLETAARSVGQAFQPDALKSQDVLPDLRGWSGLTDLTVCPPFEFRAVDALVSNFHLPKSSLLLLVAAFAGLEPVRAAYREAIRQGYRFYSYGDAMLIL
jgi:S-adenosylmethionine:tRNA ribosyltransferase-isomerase